MSYVRAQLAPNLREGDVVIWDRLGKAGKTKNPTKQRELFFTGRFVPWLNVWADYNPEARALIEAKGTPLVFLPPKGKLFNPIELLSAKQRSTFATPTRHHSPQRKSATTATVSSSTPSRTDALLSLRRTFAATSESGRVLGRSGSSIRTFIWLATSRPMSIKTSVRCVLHTQCPRNNRSTAAPYTSPPQIGRNRTLGHFRTRPRRHCTPAHRSTR